MRALVRYVGFPISHGHKFKVWYLRGDEHWADSIQMEIKWRGRYYWHCWFLPWMP